MLLFVHLVTPRAGRRVGTAVVPSVTARVHGEANPGASGRDGEGLFFVKSGTVHDSVPGPRRYGGISRKGVREACA